MTRVDEMAKAIFGAIIAALTATGAALTNNGLITPEGWVTIALAFFSTFAAVYFVPNKPREPSQEPLYVGHEEGVGEKFYKGGDI